MSLKTFLAHNLIDDRNVYDNLLQQECTIRETDLHYNFALQRSASERASPEAYAPTSLIDIGDSLAFRPSTTNEGNARTHALLHSLENQTLTSNDVALQPLQVIAEQVLSSSIASLFHDTLDTDDERSQPLFHNIHQVSNTASDIGLKNSPGCDQIAAIPS